MKDSGFKSAPFFRLSLFHFATQAHLSAFLYLFSPTVFRRCFCSSHPLTIMLGVSTDVRYNSDAARRKGEQGGKKIEDERKGNRRVTLLTSITCQFTAVAP